MQAADFKWFCDNLSELFEKYGRSFLAIKDRCILGSYGSYSEAVHETAKYEPLGSFIVQECGPDESVYTNYIASFSFR